MRGIQFLFSKMITRTSRVMTARPDLAMSLGGAMTVARFGASRGSVLQIPRDKMRFGRFRQQFQTVVTACLS